MRLSVLLSAGLAALALFSAPARAEPRLLMVEQPGCAYCALWNRQIAPAYPNTSEGRFAPLMRADLRDPPPDGVTYARKVVFTPTFLLIENGQELARMEGYVGEDFFWPMLARMLEQHTDYDPGAVEDGPAIPLEGG